MDPKRTPEPRECGRSPNCPRAGHPGPVGQAGASSWLGRMGYDATLGYPGEGPQLPHSTPTSKSETLSLITANVTSWSTGTDAGVLSSEAEIHILQEVKLRCDSLRAVKSEAKRAKYHGTWATAKRIGPCGPASGGLATLVCETRAFRTVAPERPRPHGKNGRWTHTAIGANGTQVHAINLYGWPQGMPDLWKNQNTLWRQIFSHVAGLGDVPWVMAGDWNVTPNELWVPALAPRTSGWLPDVGGRRPTCFPAQGEPTENDCCLVSHCLRGAVADYAFLPVGALPTHRAVKLTLKLEALREPVKSLRKPRTIPHPEPSDVEPQEPQAGWDPQEPRTLRRNPWVKPEAEAPGAQAMWDAWTKTAEDWLLERAGIAQGDEGPYRGRGTAPIVRMRMPLPIATHQRHGEVHGKAKVWTGPSKPLPGAGPGEAGAQAALR